jgi:hypothetical protein
MLNLINKLQKFSSSLKIQTKLIDLLNNWEKEQCVQFIKHLIVKIVTNVGQLE